MQIIIALHLRIERPKRDHLSELRLQKHMILRIIALSNERARQLSDSVTGIFRNVSRRKRLFIIPMLRRLTPSSSNFPLSTTSSSRRSEFLARVR